ncbi:MAG TPA: aminomethyl-transferring glycine dehydrogenase [Cytophagaceae bacterium]|jgi:glycine dehydrogenase|nr:aminomethyl-transferring glycine dehydrogenase [Cytophagaceae bacterium]
MIHLNHREKFEQRHLGKSTEEMKTMLSLIGIDTLDTLINQTVPSGIRLKKPLNLPEAKSEYIFLKEFKQLMAKNKICRSYIGLGYYNTITPPVILRNILENPGWYTAYTPYQAEIAQGRLEMLLNYQTMVTDLTGMEIANASLLDEATAAAEAMTMLHTARKSSKKEANVYLVSESCFPQTLDVLKTRALPLGIELKVKKIEATDVSDQSVFGIMLQTPGRDGELEDLSLFINAAHAKEISICVASDLLSLTLVTSPGEMGADVVIGSSQRLGVPMGFGGPHAAFFATKDEFKRLLPGRIIGVSIDAQGNPAYRMALQTREQHIRREKATSNICTAQVLLSVIAAAYSMYHGPKGLKAMAEKIHGLAVTLEASLKSIGYRQTNKLYFDTLSIEVEAEKDLIATLAEQLQINFRYEANRVIISLDETTDIRDVRDIVTIFAKAKGIGMIPVAEEVEAKLGSITRTSPYMTHPVFNAYHTEHQMLRYLKQLENKDLSLTLSMISLGSCTMKLNATTEMIPVTWPEVGAIHPFAPSNQTEGYKQLFINLESWLCEVTGFAGVSLQPNSGAQGEYTGLLVIRAWHQHRGDTHRNIALIPSSAHGTNPASAVMAGMKVIVVKCDDRGNIDIPDLKEKAIANKANLSCLMVTYPSTHGVFEESIVEICKVIHENGGQVYMDGANMNAQVGLTSPATIGADVCHLNLHKTFCIPHGGGGPGVGPIGVASHLVEFLPGHSVVSFREGNSIGAISAAPWGSASILPISYAYIAMMGGEGLTNATKYAILNANYMKARLEKYFPILYTGAHGRCAHEFIVDCRTFKHTVGIEVEDIAKRLMDYNFHAPTVSFPVAGTLMIEPTESESMDELDRFCDALIAIRKEIEEIENGSADKINNVLKNAPHTAHVVLGDDWTKPYSRNKAAFPLPYVKAAKFWPSVGRIDSAYGDRNLICSCIPIEEYTKEENPTLA